VGPPEEDANDDADGLDAKGDIIAIGDIPARNAGNENVVELDDDTDDAGPQEWNGNGSESNSEDEESENDDDEPDSDQPPQQQPRRSSRSGAGTRKQRPYDQFTFFSQAERVNRAKPIPRDEWEEWAIGMALIQYSIKAGLKKFGVRGEAAVTKELKQLHDFPDESK
jgi:hypothetical protein